MKLHTLALVGMFGAFGLSAEAQTCSVLCEEDFWKTASQTQIAAEISKVDVNARDGLGWTALMTAAAASTAESVKLLLDAGADVNARSVRGMTVLMFGATGGTAESVKLLLDAGADVNARNEEGSTALMLEALGGTAESVKLLLDAGADASVKDANGKTAWDYAQRNAGLKGSDAYWILNESRFK